MYKWTNAVNKKYVLPETRGLFPFKEERGLLRSTYGILLIMVGLYHVGWSLLGFGWIQSLIRDILVRYPATDLGEMAVQVFWAESQFRVLKTNIIEPWIWLICALLLLRLICHPLLHAGIFYTISDLKKLKAREQNERTLTKILSVFIKGIRKLGWSFSNFYFLQIVLTCLPMLWLFPLLRWSWQSNFASLSATVQQNILYIGCYVIYIWIIRAITIYFMLKKTQASFSDPSRVQLPVRKNFFPIIALSLLFIFTSTIMSVSVSFAAFLWSNVLALALHLSYGFFRTALLLGEVTVCYHLSQR